MTAGEITLGETADIDALLALHRTWYESNYKINIPLMQTIFPAGNDRFLMFNLNGHPYFGVDEVTHLWEFYAATDQFEMPEDYVMRVDVSGDMGYVCSEGVFRAYTYRAEDGTPLPDGAVLPYEERYRATEIYKRVSGDGGTEWKMWHYHCSLLPAADEVPPAKTAAESSAVRGMGNTPTSSRIAVLDRTG